VMSPLVPTAPRPDPVEPHPLGPATPAVMPPPVASRPLTNISPVVAPAPTPPPPRDKEYRVRPGDTLFAVAQRHGTTVTTLAAMNGLSQRAGVKTGQTLRLPDVPQPVGSTEKAPPKSGPVLSPVKTASALPVQRPVLSEVTRTLAPTQTEDRFQVKGDTIRVAAQEQLSQYATWLDVPVQRLLTLNRLSLRQSPPLGAAVRLDFSKVSATQFTQRRLQYQRGLEEEFLRRHRIGAVVTRKLKSGETLLSVSREAPGVPLWLLQRYNTHLDLNAPRPGTELRIPKVVTRSS
jgi:LysM repeat protein